MQRPWGGNMFGGRTAATRDGELRKEAEASRRGLDLIGHDNYSGFYKLHAKSLGGSKSIRDLTYLVWRPD